MCRISDVVMEVKTLTDREIYSIKTLQEVRDTFKREDVEGIENSTGFYQNASGRYKICSSDSELLSFCEGKECAENAIFACSSAEALKYLGTLMNLKRFTYNANF